MSMSRKDYEIIAEQFSRQYAAIDSRAELSETTREFMRSAIDRMAERFALVAYSGNRRFDIRRFLLAAGMREDLVSDDHIENLRQSVGFFGVTLP